MREIKSLPHKPTFRNTWRLLRFLPSYLYLAGHQGSASSSLQVAKHYYDMRIEILTRGYLQLWRYIRVWPPYLYLAGLRISLQRSLSIQILFWWENWNSFPNKPTFRHTWKHIRILNFISSNLQVARYYFDERIEIHSLSNLHLDIYEGMIEFDLYIYTWLASRISLQRPPSCQILFLMRELESWP